jgi:type II secretory pathway component PulJ
VIARALRAARRQGGFTLTEMLISMLFIGVLFGLFATVVGSTIRHNDEVTKMTTLQAEARAVLDQLAQDLRSAYTGDETVPEIESMSSTAITFFSPDRAEPFHLRRVAYRLSGGQLQRRQAISTDTDGYPWSIPALGGWITRLNSVTSTTLFTYKDANGNVTATPAEVAEVLMSVTVATTSSPSRSYTYSTSVTLREGSAS